MPWQSTICILVLLSLGCLTPREIPTETTGIGVIETAPVDTTSFSEPHKVLETFVDDSSIGRPNRNKVKLEILEGNGSDTANRPLNVARIEFYSKTPANEWKLQQTLKLETHALMEAQPEIKDFNNDGLNDITFVSNTAARGANEVRTLLIFDKNTDSLVHIKNSEDYPNLAYNKTLKCIDSWMFHGATTTVFLKLDGDMLEEFAWVSTGGELIVEIIGKDGERKEIGRQKMSPDDVYTRYETFRPPRPYSAESPANSYPRRF